MPFDPNRATKFCKFEDCGKPLRNDNTFELCTPHRHREFVGTPERKAIDNEKRRIRYESDPVYAETARTRSSAYYDSHSEESKASRKAYRQANPDMFPGNAARRAKRLGLLVEQVHRTVVWRRDGGVCHLCQLPADPADWAMEHIIPISKGGPHCYANVAVSHPACNSAKYNRSGSPMLDLDRRASDAFWSFHVGVL